MKTHNNTNFNILGEMPQEHRFIIISKLPHNCKFAVTEIAWLGYKINPGGIIPTTKMVSIIKLVGSIHHLQKFIPNLSQISAPLRPLLSQRKNKKRQTRLERRTQSFKRCNQTNSKKKSDTNRLTRVRRDASKEGLGACLEHKYDNGWHPIAYASRFLNTNEQKYSINELELLSVVWPLEHFKYYLYGSRFTLQTDHQALLSALKDNRGNKTYQSTLKRWVDRLTIQLFGRTHCWQKDVFRRLF